MKKILIIALILASCSQKQEPQVRMKGRTFINGPADTTTYRFISVVDSAGTVLYVDKDGMYVEDSARAIKALLKAVQSAQTERDKLREIIHTIQVNERARPALL